MTVVSSILEPRINTPPTEDASIIGLVRIPTSTNRIVKILFPASNAWVSVSMSGKPRSKLNIDSSSYKGISLLIPPNLINPEWYDPVTNPINLITFSLYSKAYKNGVKAPRSIEWVVTANRLFNILATSINIVLITEAYVLTQQLNSFSIPTT